MFSEKASRTGTKLHILILMLCLNLCTVLFTSCTISEKKNEETEKLYRALEYQAASLNNVLPQKLDLNTHFDSVGFGSNQLRYYYSLSNLSEKDFLEKELRDSLYAEAVDRIPCTLWRPVYMQGVEVTFNYYSSDGKRILHFARQGEACYQ